MDAIESFDWGVYSHFRFQDQTHPVLLSLMQVAYYLSSCVGVVAFLVIALMVFLVQGKYRSALVAGVSFALAYGLIEGVRALVPRRRPEDADRWLGAQDMQGSYPSPAVFLFMLAMILLGFAIWDLAHAAWLRGLYVFIAASLTAWVFMSQLFLSLHFLTDLFGGMAGAALVGWIASRFLERAGRSSASGLPACPSPSASENS